MDRVSKWFSLLLVVILAASSLMMIESANAQSTSKPSVPEFTAKYVDRSYNTQPTYGLDQYTGKTVITKPSEHVDNRTIEIEIKNQLFAPFTDQNGNNINLLYNVQYKGSFGKNWTSMFGERSEWAGTVDPYGTYGFPTQDSSSQYTTISYSLPWNVVDGKMDIQVEALKGYTNRTIDPSRAHILWSVYIYTFYGEESGWSNTQTVTIGGASASTPNPTSPTTSTLTPTSTLTKSPTPTPTVPEFPSLTIPLILGIMLVSAGLLVYHKKRS
jgi:hypothetical protein